MGRGNLVYSEIWCSLREGFQKTANYPHFVDKKNIYLNIINFEKMDKLEGGGGGGGEWGEGFFFKICSLFFFFSAFC